MASRGMLFSAARYLDVSSATLPFTFMEIVHLRMGGRPVSQLLSAEVVAEIGKLEAQSLRGSPYFFMEMEIEPDREDRALLAFLRLVQVFLLGLWFVKDHAVHVEMGFLHVPRVRTDSLFIGEVISAANGQQTNTTVSLSELKEARKWSEFCWSFHLAQIEKDRETSRVTDLRDNRIIALKGVSRLVRTMYFLQAARATRDISVKIAHLMTCLEVLFSTSEGELTHRLSERVAFFTGDAARRLEVYRLMKDAYSIRSKVVHGDEIKPSVASRAPTIAQQVDELLRSVLRKIGDGGDGNLFDSKAEDLDAYFENLIFGTSAFDTGHA